MARNKNTTAITKLRIAQGVDVEGKKCHYCLDTHVCHICQGAKMIPSWDSKAGRFRQHGGRILCWNCKGSSTCPRCAEPTPEAA